MSPDSLNRPNPEALHVAFYGDEALGQAEEAAGKFVMLRKGFSLHVVFSPIEKTPYHAHIVRQYLRDLGGPDVTDISATGALIHGSEWKVLGGGYYQIDPVTRSLTLSGKSSAFGRYPAAVIEPHGKELLRRLGMPEGSTVLLH